MIFHLWDEYASKNEHNFTQKEDDLTQKIKVASPKNEDNLIQKRRQLHQKKRRWPTYSFWRAKPIQNAPNGPIFLQGLPLEKTHVMTMLLQPVA